jgi:hypothetical protein
MSSGEYIQSILFNKNNWTVGNARSWLKSHGYKSSGKVHITNNYFRFRQFAPKNYSYRTLDIGNGIMFIIKTLNN